MTFIHLSIKQNDFSNAYGLPMLEDKIGTSELYYTDLGKFYLYQRRFDDAVNALDMASKYSSSPELFILLNRSYIMNGNKSMAIDKIKILRWMLPHHFYPEMYLMRTYIAFGDKANAIKIANDILIKPVKIKSKKIDNIKNEAKMLIKNYEK